MDEAERAFADALRRGAAAMPAVAPFDPQQIVGAATLARSGHRLRAWWTLGVAAAVFAMVGAGAWVLRPLAPLPATPATPFPSETVGTTSPEPPPTSLDLPYVSYQPPTPLGTRADGLLQGTLTRVEGGCLVVANGDDVTIPVLPAAETSWDAANGRLVISGTSLDASGGHVGFDGSYTARPPAGATIPTACAQLEGRYFAVSSLDQNPYPTDPGPDLFATTRALPHAPAVVRDDAGRTSCGEIVLGQGEQVPDSARECLEAAQGHNVELAFTVPTIEGDPMVYFVLGKPGEPTLELFHTAYWDRYGASGTDVWWHATCPASAVANAGAFWQCTVDAGWEPIAR